MQVEREPVIQPTSISDAMYLSSARSPLPASGSAPVDLGSQAAAEPIRRDTAEFSSEALERLAAEQAAPDT